MAAKSSESGMDELRRLSRQTADMGQKMQEEAKQRAEYEQNMIGVMQGLRGISFSVALKQLEDAAPREIYEKVEAMQLQPDVKDLRKLITDLTRTLERTTSRAARNNPELDEIAGTARTLAILVSLLFSLK